MRFRRQRGPVTFGWRIYLGKRVLLGVTWQPYDDTAPWVPFVPDRWSAWIVIWDSYVWQWNRWANRFGHAPR